MLGHVRSRIIEHSNDLNDGQRLGAGLTLYKQTVWEAAALCPRPKVDRQRLALGGGVEYVVHI